MASVEANFSLEVLAANAATLIALSSECLVDGMPLAQVATDGDLMIKYAKSHGKAADKVMARDFCRVVLGLQTLASVAPNHCRATVEVMGARKPNLKGGAKSVSFEGPQPLVTQPPPVAGTPMVPLHALPDAPMPPVEDWRSMASEVGLIYAEQLAWAQLWLMRGLRFTLLFGPLLMAALTLAGWTVLLVICFAMPELPIRLIAALLRLVPRYLEWAGSRVADAVLMELSSAFHDTFQHTGQAAATAMTELGMTHSTSSSGGMLVFFAILGAMTTKIFGT